MKRISRNILKIIIFPLASFALSLAVLSWLSEARAAPLFGAEQREVYLAQTLQGFKNLSAKSGSKVDQIYQFVDISEKQKCRSLFEAFTLNCLQSEVKAYCNSPIGQQEGGACKPVADVVLVNKINERQLITKDDQFKISQSREEYSKAYRRALDAKYAAITAEFLLKTDRCENEDSNCLTKNLDDYCRKHADAKNIPWQACVSAVIWFIGTSQERLML